MRKAADIGWKPVQYLNNVSARSATTMKPAGFENVQGVITAAWLKDPTDKQWDDDADMKAWRAWMAKYMPGGNLGDVNYVYAYCGVVPDARDAEEVRRRPDAREPDEAGGQPPEAAACRACCRASPSRPARPTSTRSRRCSLQRFKGETWELFGEILSAESS